MTQDQLKQAVAQAAVDHILPKLNDRSIVGVGTGSTANFFIDLLAKHKGFFDGAVASSEATAERLKQHGIPVYDLNSVSELEFYVDGADEANKHLELIKGGGAALTREKIVAAVAKTFICIADGASWSSSWAPFRCRWRSSRWRAAMWRASWSSSAATRSTATAW